MNLLFSGFIGSAPMRLVAMAGLLLASSGVYAIGIGNIQVNSVLNEPLSASIPVVGASQENLVNMTVRLADAATFEKAGIGRSYLLTRLKFEVIDDGDGRAHIAVTSTNRIKEPALEFIIDVDWGQGQLRRTYGILLEPPR
jgi:pilus assembly protein FimV